MADLPVNPSSAFTLVDVVTNGQTHFDFDFRVDFAADLVVEYRSLDELPVTVDPSLYSVTGLGTEAGGGIDFTGFVTVAGDKVLLYRSIEIERQTDYTRDLFSDDINSEMDRVFMILQEQRRDLDRALKLAIGEAGESADDFLTEINQLSVDVELAKQAAIDAADTASSIAASKLSLSAIGSMGAQLIAAANVAAVTAALTLGTAAFTNANAYATAGQGTQAANALARSGGTMTGAITGDDGGIHRSSKWLLNDIRDFGAVTGTGAVQDAALTLAKAADQIRVKRGSYRVSDGYDFSTTSIWVLDHGAKFTKADGSPTTAGLGWLQVAPYLNKGFEIEARGGGMMMTATRRIKKDDTPITVGGDETVLFDAQLWYQRQIAPGSGLNGYSGGGTNMSLFNAYGFAGAASGSTGVYQARQNIYNAEDKGGRNEIINFSSGLGAIQGGVVAKANIYNLDLVTWTTIDQQESFKADIALASKKLHAGQIRDADHDGAFGITVETAPTIGGYGAPMLTTSPQDMGVVVTGYSGAPSVGSGYDVGADLGWKWAFFAGGRNGVWLNQAARSKIGRGMGIVDYTISGIEIFNAHPSAADPFAIRTAEDAGRIAFAVNNPLSYDIVHIGNGALAGNSNIHLYETAHATSARSGINFNERFLMGTDAILNGAHDFFIAQNGQPASIRIQYNAVGFPMLFITLPTSSAGLTSGAAYWNANVLTRVP